MKDSFCTSGSSPTAGRVKVGRNDLCRCGSGIKYKRCCLAKDEQERREQAEYDARWNTEIWYPKASDLQLPDVPENLRPQARSVLERALPPMFERDVEIRARNCWQIAQGLTLAADGAIDYVEGVWERSLDNAIGNPDGKNPEPHAWNSFRGHIIDLVAEFYNWRSSGDDSPWLHEPLKEYTFSDLCSFEDEYECGLDGYDISSIIWLEAGEHYKVKGDINSIVFQPARDRLLARINATGAKAA